MGQFGCQSAKKSNCPNVRCLCPVPPAPIVQTPMRPLLPSRLKAIRIPLGENVGANSRRLVAVSWVSFVPSGLHDPDVVQRGAVAIEDELGAVGRPLWERVEDPGVRCEVRLVRAVGVHHVTDVR
jgi:hypothetical protein